MKITIFLDVAPCSLVDKYQFRMNLLSSSVSFLKVEARWSSETLVPIYQSTQCRIPEHNNLNRQRLENFRSCKHTRSCQNFFSKHPHVLRCSGNWVFYKCDKNIHPFHVLRNFTKLSLYVETNNLFSTQEIPIWGSGVYYRVHKSSLRAPFLSQMNPVHNLLHYFLDG
jgi:hypothetical protein